jgi:ABC-2 type transport system ATP-binding protein
METLNTNLGAEAAVSIRNLSKRFTRTLALDDVTFDIPANSLFGLLGPNGAGKTTLFSIAAGFLKATGGGIEVLGCSVSEISRLRGRFSMLPQDASFQAGIPVIDQLVMFARLNGYMVHEAQQRAKRALGIVGLEEVARRSARALSHGMLKRVALCQAFIGEPEVIFLDEPTSGLDPENARKMRVLIQELRESQTVVISSHNLREIQEVCDHVAILNEGRLQACASMDDLTGTSLLVRIVLSEPLTQEAERDLLALSGVTSVQRSSETEFNLSFELDDPASQKKAVLKEVNRVLVIKHDLVPTSIQEGESLEVRFLEITGGEYDGIGGT